VAISIDDVVAFGGDAPEQGRENPLDYWVMNIRHALSILGLICDLWGAILLSIPMVWDTREAAYAIGRLVKKCQQWVYGDSFYDDDFISDMSPNKKMMVNQQLTIIGLLFAFTFLMKSLRLIGVSLSGSNPGRFSPYSIINIIFVFGLISLVIYKISLIPRLVIWSLMWIAVGKHERRIGFLGVGILCIGFVLQAWVNVLPDPTPSDNSSTMSDAKASIEFLQGLGDRLTWKMWFRGLKGEYRDGADYWSGQRSLHHPGSCYDYAGNSLGDITSGCLAAQNRLTPYDHRRQTEPTYRKGWNSL
jgi:hypothetical protein